MKVASRTLRPNIVAEWGSRRVIEYKNVGDIYINWLTLNGTECVHGNWHLEHGAD